MKNTTSCFGLGKLCRDKRPPLTLVIFILFETKLSYIHTDYCYNQQVSNQQIYDHSIKRIALSSLQGINGKNSLITRFP